MRNLLWWCVFVAICAAGTPLRAADAPMPEIVVAMRYLQQSGASHAHLYLYREDGKFLRQITNDQGGQDQDPVFSPDGETIVFARSDHADKITGYWSVEPRGGNLHQLPAAPDWYTATKTSPHFEHIYNGPPIMREPRPAPGDPRTFTTPDGKLEVKITPVADSLDFGSPDTWEVHLRTSDDGKETRVEKLLGYSAGFLSRDEGGPEQCLLREKALDVVFCFVHLNSTDGNTVYALDLNAKRLVRLSPNWAAPFPLPGEPAFLTWTENRYLPYGDGKHTANCSYVEHWDAGWKAVRYAKAKAAGECYGASMYRPGLTPAVIAIRTDNN